MLNLAYQVRQMKHQQTTRQPPDEATSRMMQQKAEELFEQTIRHKVDQSRPNDFVLIDVISGDFEVDEREIEACERLRSRHPDGLLWCRKVGSPYSRKIRSPRYKPA